MPIVAPIIGGLIGAGLYKVLIGTFLSDEATPDDPAAVPIDPAVPAEQPAA